MLRRLGLQLFGCFQIWHEGEVDGYAVLFRKLPLELTHRFHERLGFHISHGTSDLGDDYVVFAGLAEQEHSALYLIGDVRHDLHCLAQICAFALLGDDGVVDLAGGDIVRLRGAHAEKSLVVSEVEVGLRAVVGHIAFAVLIGVEGTRVYVYVWVEFLNGHSESACLKQFGQ